MCVCLNQNLKLVVKVNRDELTNDLEANVIMTLNERKYNNFPKLWIKCVYNEKPILVMEKLGPSLSDILNTSYPDGFSLKTVQQIGIKMVTILEQLHSIGYIHCDLKPDNICVANNKGDTNFSEIKLIDFGICKKINKDGSTKEPAGNVDHVEIGPSP